MAPAWHRRVHRPPKFIPTNRTDETPGISVQDAWSTYGFHTETLSKFVRNMSLTGFVVIWAFHDSVKNRITQPLLSWAVVVFALALMFDVLQYLFGAAIYRVLARRCETRRIPFENPSWAPAVGEVMFVLKVILTIAGWILVCTYMGRSVLTFSTYEGPLAKPYERLAFFGHMPIANQ